MQCLPEEHQLDKFHGRQLDGSQPVQVDKCKWVAKVQSQYSDPDKLEENLQDLDLLFREYG